MKRILIFWLILILLLSCSCKTIIKEKTEKANQTNIILLSKLDEKDYEKYLEKGYMVIFDELSMEVNDKSFEQLYYEEKTYYGIYKKNNQINYVYFISSEIVDFNTNCIEEINDIYINELQRNSEYNRTVYMIYNNSVYSTKRFKISKMNNDNLTNMITNEFVFNNTKGTLNKYETIILDDNNSSVDFSHSYPVSSANQTNIKLIDEYFNNYLFDMGGKYDVKHSQKIKQDKVEWSVTNQESQENKSFRFKQIVIVESKLDQFYVEDKNRLIISNETIDFNYTILFNNSN